MSINKKVAKAYIEKFRSDKELKDKDDFIREYIKASNASTGSKYDSRNTLYNNLSYPTPILFLFKLNTFFSFQKVLVFQNLYLFPVQI